MDSLSIGAAASIISIVVAGGGTVWGFYKWAYSRGTRNARHVEKQLEYVYGPLCALLTDTHIASADLTLYPTIKIRFRRAYRLLKSREYMKAARAPFDKGTSSSGAEIEYGRPIPLAEVWGIVSSHGSLVDHELVSKYWAVRREEIEDAARGMTYPSFPLSKNYLALFDHIVERHEHLARMLET